MAQRLRALLAACCDVVQSVEDGSALIAAVETFHPDVIVSDIAMPRLSGLEAARIISARDPAARIVFVTIRDEPSVVRAAFDCGALGYVMKGDAGDELLSAVSAALAGKRYVSAGARPAMGSSTNERL